MTPSTPPTTSSVIVEVQRRRRPRTPLTREAAEHNNEKSRGRDERRIPQGRAILPVVVLITSLLNSFNA